MSLPRGGGTEWRKLHSLLEMVHFPDSKRVTRWEYVILRGVWSAMAVGILEEFHSSLFLAAGRHCNSLHTMLVVIDLGLLNAHLHTGRWGNAAFFIASLAQEDETWGKQRQGLHRIMEYPELEGMHRDH
ncbi:hypothetical protein TURU_036957 [Turdus rufiventris]|nr:hypothetical protein TURU_036957 [Turdus rufiventris]